MKYFYPCLLLVFVLFNCISQGNSYKNKLSYNDITPHIKKKFYAVDNVDISEFNTIKDNLGEDINLILLGIDCTDFVSLENAIINAEENNLKIIIWPSGHGHQWTPWDYSDGEWDITEGIDFFNYIENYIKKGGSAVYAVLMSHEPFWNHGKPFTSDQMKALYSKLKTYAPNTKLFVYINSLVQNELNQENVVIEEGLGDIVGIWWHPYGKAEGAPTEDDVIQFIKDDIKLIKDRNLNMEILFAIQCFGWLGHNYYMPDADELLSLSNKVLHIDGLDGIIWYSWDDYNSYTASLKKKRFDRKNIDRWEVIKFLNSNHK